MSAAEARTVRRLYWTAFALRFGAGMLAWAVTELYGLEVMVDASMYSRRAAEAAQDWLSFRQNAWLAQAFEGGRQPWFMVGTLACFYCLTGGTEFLPVALFGYSLLTAYTPVLAYRAGRQLGLPAPGALFPARLVAYTPAFAFWSGALYKEGLVLVALYLVIVHGLRLQREFRPRSVVILALSFLAIFGLRFYLGAILAAALVAGVALGRRGRAGGDPVSGMVKQLLILVVLASVFGLLGFGDRIGRMVSWDVEENLAQINNSRRDLASHNSGYLRDTDVSTVDAAVRFVPVGMAYFMTVPLPWHIGSWRQNLTIAETLFWVVFVYPKVARGLVRGIRANPQGVTFLVLAALAMTAFYALFIGNIGTAYRMRIQVWAIIALLAGWAVSRPRAARPAPWAAATPTPAAPGPRPGPVLP